MSGTQTNQPPTPPAAGAPANDPTQAAPDAAQRPDTPPAAPAAGDGASYKVVVDDTGIITASNGDVTTLCSAAGTTTIPDHWRTTHTGNADAVRLVNGGVPTVAAVTAAIVRKVIRDYKINFGTRDEPDIRPIRLNGNDVVPENPVPTPTTALDKDEVAGGVALGHKLGVHALTLVAFVGYNVVTSGHHFLYEQHNSVLKRLVKVIGLGQEVEGAFGAGRAGANMVGHAMLHVFSMDDMRTLASRPTEDFSDRVHKLMQIRIPAAPPALSLARNVVAAVESMRISITYNKLAEALDPIDRKAREHVDRARDDVSKYQVGNTDADANLRALAENECAFATAVACAIAAKCVTDSVSDSKAYTRVISSFGGIVQNGKKLVSIYTSALNQPDEEAAAAILRSMGCLAAGAAVPPEFRTTPAQAPAAAAPGGAP